MSLERIKVRLEFGLTQRAVISARGGYLTGRVPKVLNPSFGEFFHLQRIQVRRSLGIETDWRNGLAPKKSLT